MAGSFQNQTEEMRGEACKGCETGASPLPQHRGHLLYETHIAPYIGMEREKREGLYSLKSMMGSYSFGEDIRLYQVAAIFLETIFRIELPEIDPVKMML